MLLARVNASAADETRSAFGWATHTLMVENLFRETLAELTEAESSQRGFLLTGDEVYAYSFAPAADSVGRLVATLRMLTVDNPEQQRRLDTLQRLIARRLTLLRTIAALTRAGHRDSAIRIVQLGHGRTVMDSARSTVGRALAAENVLWQHRKKAVEAALARRRVGELLIVCLALLALALAAIVGIWLRRAERFVTICAW